MADKRISELPSVTNAADADVLMLDGVDGYRKQTFADLKAQLASEFSGAPNFDSDSRLKEMTAAEGFELTGVNYDSDSVITTATVKWPDGSSGVFTTVTKNTTFLTVDGYTITHTSSGKTVTQPTVTRDSLGNITTKPALTVS